MEQKRLVVLLADISGYTRFMLETATSAVHGQMLVDSLIEAIVSKVDIPLVLQEIEGDAVFLYAADPGSEQGWQQVLRDVGRKLEHFFAAFISQMGVAAESAPCGCTVCANIDKLGLKLIVHVGEAVFHEVAGRARVSGGDVILAHRLLKNTVPSNEYLLLTEAAWTGMRSELDGEFEIRQETCEGFGEIGVRVRYLEQRFTAAREALYRMDHRARCAAVGEFLDASARRAPQAVRTQLETNGKRFPWYQRLVTRTEVELMPLLTPLLRRILPRRQRLRGKPRRA